MTYILMGDGFEEAEALVPADMLRRAGIDAKLVSVTRDLNVVGSHGIAVCCDLWVGIAAKEPPEALILPGGLGGVKAISESHRAVELIRACFADEKVLIGAICAAPTLLSSMGLIKANRATCYPGMKDKMDCAGRGEGKVVKDGRLITSQAAGTAYEFAFALIEALRGEDAARKVKDSVYFG